MKVIAKLFRLKSELQLIYFEKRFLTNIKLLILITLLEIPNIYFIVLKIRFNF